VEIYKPYNHKCDWHTWFAWLPVVVHTYEDGSKKMIWLSRVLRKETLHLGFECDYYTWEYKEIR